MLTLIQKDYYRLQQCIVRNVTKAFTIACSTVIKASINQALKIVITVMWRHN